MNDHKALLVPFLKEAALSRHNASNPIHTSKPIHPAVIRDGDFLLQPKQDLNRYLDLELKTPKLNKLLPHLWLAGLPKSARPLHRQIITGRTIICTEDPNEHLVWIESRIFIKPLPIYLFSYDFWTEHLCHDRELYKSACGLILSYAWLVSYQSDLRIATETGLLPPETEWAKWTAFIADFLAHCNPDTLELVHERYHFGELRLTRLNAIHRIKSVSLHRCTRGYMSSSTWYRAFFSKNFAWLVAVFFYITVILSAMQVGLATEKLQQSQAFQNASWGFAMLAVGAVIFSVFVVFCVWLVLFLYHLVSTRQYYHRVERKRRMLRDDIASVKR